MQQIKISRGKHESKEEDLQLTTQNKQNNVFHKAEQLQGKILRSNLEV